MTIYRDKNNLHLKLNFTNEIRETLAEFFLIFLKSHMYFKNKTISHDFLREIYKIGHFDSDFSSLRSQISHRLGVFTHKMKDLGYIIKHNKLTYKKVKEIDMSFETFKAYFKFFEKNGCCIKN